MEIPVGSRQGFRLTWQGNCMLHLIREIAIGTLFFVTMLFITVAIKEKNIKKPDHRDRVNKNVSLFRNRETLQIRG